MNSKARSRTLIFARKGSTEEADACEYMKNRVRAGGAPAPDDVEAMIVFDGDFPHVRTYYSNVPPFLQTLKYVGPGMGLAMKIASGAGDVTLEYPAESGVPESMATPTPPETPVPTATPA